MEVAQHRIGATKGEILKTLDNLGKGGLLFSARRAFRRRPGDQLGNVLQSAIPSHFVVTAAQRRSRTGYERQSLFIAATEQSHLSAKRLLPQVPLRSLRLCG